MEGGALQWGHEHVLVEILLLLVEDAIYWCKQARKWRGSRDNPTGAGVYSEMEVIRTTNPSSRAEIRKIQETRRGHWWNRKKCCYGMELYPDGILSGGNYWWYYLTNGTISPMELLCRWYYFADGTILPMEFIHGWISSSLHGKTHLRSFCGGVEEMTRRATNNRSLHSTHTRWKTMRATFLSFYIFDISLWFPLLHTKPIFYKRQYMIQRHHVLHCKDGRKCRAKEEIQQ